MIAVIQTESIARKGHGPSWNFSMLSFVRVDSPNRSIFQTYLPHLSELDRYMSSIFVLRYTTAPTIQFPKKQILITSTVQAVQGEGNKCLTN